MSQTPNPPLPNELPESWIDQIKKAVKKDSWKVIICTTVLTASLGFGFNLLLERYKSRSAIHLESIKTENAQNAKQREEKQKLLLQLGTKLGELKEKLEVAVRTFKSSSGNAKLIKSAQGSLDEAAGVMEEIFTLIREPRLPQELSENNIRPLLNELASRLVETRDSKSLAGFADYYDKECLPKIRRIHELLSRFSENP